jgi:hypothetical protein
MELNKKIEGTRLTAIRFSHSDQYFASYYWFRCECGNEKVIRKSPVICGKVKSCGCFKTEIILKTGIRYPEQKGKEQNYFKKGDVPWNKGKKGSQEGRKKGHILIKYPNGNREWIKPD